MKLTLILSLALVSGTWAQRSIIVYNGCPFTMWPAMYTGLGSLPDYPTGWEAAPYSSVIFQVPSNWSAAQIWGRRDCDFRFNPGPNSCLDGGCLGGFECDPNISTTTTPAAGPATLAEFTLGAGGVDYYDVSLVYGYNLPVAITNTVGCGVADCPVDLGPSCPPPLIGPFDSNNFPVGCKSACEANLDGDPSNSYNCCTGRYDSAKACPSSGVEYYDYFKGNCPNSWVYGYDEDASSTALWTCPSDLNAVYTVTFCPSPSEV